MPWDEMETHTQEVQCCLPYIIFCNRGFFFHIYTILSYILRKKQWKPGCQSTFLLRKI